MTAPRAREQYRPPSPGRPSLISDRIRRRPAGLARLRGTRRALLRSARALAAAACLALFGALALPSTAEAQTPPVCDRTEQVRDGIVAEVPAAHTCVAVTDADLTAITSLDLNSTGITSLKESDFSGLTALTVLNLDGNSLSDLPAGVFDGLTALTVLHLSGNPLSGLQAGVFDGLTALRSLVLVSNSLSNLPADVFDGLTALTVLELGNNSLSDLPAGVFDGLTALRELFLVNNSLSNLPAGVFDGLTALRELSLAGNSLSDLPAGVFDGLTALETLDLYDNSLSNLQAGVFDGLTALRELNLYDNSLSNLQAGVFDGLTALRELHLYDNSLSNLQAGVFNGLTALETLWLNDISLSNLQAGVFDGLTALETLSLGRNSLITLPDDVFDDLTALTVLNLSNNSLTTLPDDVFDGLTSLDVLSLAENNLTELPDGLFDKLTSLMELVLRGNPGAPFAPTASARPDDGTISAAGGTVTLDGSGSGGAWGTNVTYFWALTNPASGVTVAFDNATRAKPVVTIPALTAGTALTFTLTVTGVIGIQGGIAGTTDTAKVTVVPAPAVLISGADGLKTGEDGTTATFQVRLAAAPANEVTVTPSSSDTGEGTVSGALTFNTANWNTARAVTATGVDDADLDGEQTFSITFRVESTDPDYAGISVPVVSVTNVDDESLALNLDAIAGDDTVNIAEKAAGFAIGGDTGSEAGVAVSVTIGTESPLTATSAAGGAWSVSVPPGASYLTGTSVAVTVSASKTGYTAPSDVTRALAVDLAAPTASYTAPGTLKVGVAVGAMTPSTTATDIASYGATGLPSGLGIDTGTGVVSGTPDTADANTASATVTVTDTAGNPATVSIAFPAVAKGDQTLTGFAYSAATVTYGDTAPTLTAPGGVQTTLTYAATPATVCTVDASTGALTLVEVGACVITATAAGTADWNQATATFTVTVQAAGALALNLDAIAGDDTVNIAEKAAGFAIGGDTGTESGVSLTVTVGSTPLTATSDAGGAWSVAVPADAAYLTGTGVAVTVSASKTGYTAPSDVTRALAVDLAAPTASYTAPGTLKVGVAIGAMTPSTTATDIAEYGATGLPPGLGIDTGTGVVSGTPDTADTNTASATVTVTDTAGNPATVSIAFPAVARGDQTLSGFQYSSSTVTFGATAPTLTAPSGVQTTLTYAAAPAAVCTVHASTGALTPVEVGACVITATAAGTADWNQATATFTVTVQAAGALALNLDAIAGDDTVNIAEKAAGFAIGGDTGTESGVSVTVTVGSTPLTATSDAGGAWSVAVPADAAYLTGTSVAVTVSASKTGYTAPSDVTRALAVDLAAPTASYTAPGTLKVGVAVGAMTPSTTATDIASYGATGLPPGLGIDTGTGVISGTPDTADTNTASATVTVTDTAGNPATVSIAFPAVARGDQTLTGFAYSAATVTYGATAPTLTAPSGVQTTLTYAVAPAAVCTVHASTGALTPVEVGACVITATAAGTADWNQATATFTVTVAAAGALALNLDVIAGDDTVNIAEKAAGFAIGGDTGTESGVNVTVTVGTTDLTATSAAGGAWSVSVPPGASYLTGTSVAVTVSASKTGYTAPSDVTRALAVDLAAPTASYTAPGTLKVGVAVGAMTPSTTATDIAEYGATGLPPGLGIDTGTGVISGTPDTADANTASATVTVTDTAGNPATVSIAFPAVARGDQTLSGFQYSSSTVTFGSTAPTVTAPGGVQTTLSYAAAPAAVCTVDASTGALTPVEVGACVITATAAGTADWNQATATFTVTVVAAGALALNLDVIAGDDTVNIAEKAAGFAIGGATGTESGVSVTVTVGSTPLTATSDAGGAWSVAVPADAAYLTGTGVAVTVSASKTGYTAPSDVTRALAVDLAAPTASYTAPGTLKVGVAVGAMTPSTTATDIAEYGATGLPPGLGIDTGTGVVSGTPDTADTNTASATVTVTDTAGNPATVSIAFPAVARGDQTLSGFQYSSSTVTFGATAPTLTAPSGVQTTLTYAAAPAAVCTVHASTGALTPVEVGACVITATAAGTADWNQATATFTVTVAAAGALALNLDVIAGDDTVNIAEKAAGFAIGGATGTESGVSVTVTVGSTPLTATSDAGGAWSVAVPADAAYLTGTSVAVTVSASKTGYTAPSDVTRALAVDLAAPTASYTAPGTLKVGVAVGAMTPSTTATDIAEYGATGLPPGLGIDTGTGVISGTPDTADANTASATVTVTDTAGNPATVSIAFPAVARGDQTLSGFQYSSSTVTFGSTAPTVTAPGGVQTTLSYAAAPAAVCTVDASTGALTPVEVGACVITATAAGTADWNQATATFTVTVVAAGALALNLDAIAGDDTVSIAEKAAGFMISGDTGTESGVSLTVTVGSTPLTATSDSGGAWSVAVPADAAYLTGTGVAVTVSASKTGYTAPSDVTRTLEVDLAAPTASYTAPGTLQVGVAIGAMTPSTTATDIAEYGATGLPPGLGIDTGTGVISGTPDTADANTASAAVTVKDTAGNTATVSIAFPAVVRGDQTLTGFAYSPASVTFGGAAPAVTAPGGAQTTLSYSATPATVCTVDASTGALTLVEVGDCNITATAAGTANYNEATAAFTVTVQAAGALALNLDTIAGDDTVNIAEKAAGFMISGDTGTESGVSLTVTVGSTPLTATSDSGGAWSVAVPADAAYLTGTGVAVTVSASKTGYTAPSDVTRALAVDLTAPSATYTAPSSLQVGVAVSAMTPTTTDTDIASYGATGLPPGLGIDSTTGAISGTPDTADANTAHATVTVTDTAGNPATVSTAFPAVARGNQTLTGFAYSAATATYGDTAPTVTAPGGVQTTLSYSAKPSDVCTVDSSTGALTLEGAGSCAITVTAAPSADYNRGTATYTVTVAEDPEGFDVAVSAPAALDEDAGAAAVTVTLMTRKNRAPLADIDMHYVGKRGETATRGADYTPPPGRDFGGATGVFFATVRPSAFSPNAAGTAWVAEPSFTIGIIDDQKAEVAETIVFTVALGNDRSPAHTITIRDNDAIAPGRPTGLQAAPRSATGIKLSWTAPGSTGGLSITGYRVEASENTGGPWVVVAADTRNTRPSWGHGGLSAGDTRHYRVSAISPAGTSGPSNVASATTIAAGPAGTNPALPPPTNVGAVPKLPGEIRLSWWRNDDVPSHELVERHQYRYRVRNAGAWTVDWTTVNQTMLPELWPTEIRNYNKVLLKGLTERKTYEFQVRSVDTDGGTSAAVAVLGAATGRQTVWIVADVVGSVAEGESLRFTVSRDQPHGPMMVIVRISETEDMLPPEGRSPEGLWHQQVNFGNGNEEIPLVLDTVDDGGGPEKPSVVTVEVISYPLYPDNPDNGHLYVVQPDVGPAKITVTAAGGSSAGSVAEPLTAAFEGLPEAHDGETAFSFRLAFSEAVAVTPEAMRTRVLTVAGGAVTGAARVDGESGVWEITVTPDSRDDLSITLAPTEDCAADGAVCTSDGRALSVVAAHIVLGPGPETQTPEEPALTASFEGLPEAHDGETAFRFRVAFSEDIGIGYRSLRDASFTVSGGAVTGARRVDGRHDLWEITVEPDSDEAMTFALPGGRECAVSGAICTRGENRRRLTNTPTATVAGPAVEPVVVPLTASFVQAPYEHDGKTAFKFRIAFSEGISIGFRTFRDQSLSVSGGSVTKAKRVDRRKDLWEVTVKPGSLGDVTVTLEGGRACGTAGAVCTGDGRALSATISTTVLRPVALSVADARVREASDVTLDFAVTLSRASRAPVAVGYATADGSATAGSDYTATSGTLSFAAGETAKTVSVPVLDDAHDEGEETLTLRLSAATGAVIADGVATGTIENTDHMPTAWLARFGRTVTDQVLEAVEARLVAPRAAGARATLAGQTLPSWDGGKTADNADASDRALRADARDREAMTAIRDWMAHAGADGEWRAPGEGPEGVQSRALTGRDFLTGTSFALTGGSAEAGGYAALWGRGAISRFDGREGDLTLDGEVTTGLMGADWATERWTAGLAVGHARGTGGYSEGGDCTAGDNDNGASGCAGEVEATLTGVWPYAGLTLTDRLSAWAAAGYGAGSLTLTPGGETDGPFTADLTMAMGAAGMRGEVLTPPPEGGLALALKGDARFTRTASEATKDAKGGNLAAATADVWLVRTGIEGSRRFAPGGAAAGLVLTPSFELGVRLDGGDAETGLGVDLGGGLAFAAPKQGVALDLKARGLVAHEAPGFREWGASASLTWDPRPSTDRGLALTLRQSWGGSPTGGMDALLGRETLAGLADNGATTATAGRLEAELGYGIAMFGGRFTGTPEIGVGLSDTGRDYRLGWRLGLGSGGGASFELGLEATRREPANDNEAEHMAGFRVRATW